MTSISKLLDAFQRSTGVDPRDGHHVIVTNRRDCERRNIEDVIVNDKLIARYVRPWVPDDRLLVMNYADLDYHDDVYRALGHVRITLLGVGEWQE